MAFQDSIYDRKISKLTEIEYTCVKRLTIKKINHGCECEVYSITVEVAKM